VLMKFFNKVFSRHSDRVTRYDSLYNFIFSQNTRPANNRKYDIKVDLLKYNVFYFSLDCGFGNILEAITPILALKKKYNINVNFVIADKFYPIHRLLMDFSPESEFVKSSEFASVIKYKKDALLVRMPFDYIKFTETIVNKIDLTSWEFAYDSKIYKEYLSHTILIEKIFNVSLQKFILDNWFSLFNSLPLEKKKGKIGICNGVRGKEYALRQYPHFSELVDLLSESYELRSFGSPNEYIDGTIDLTNSTYNFTKTFSDMRECDYIIGSDCGMMHLAERSGTNTIWLFGPTVSNRVGPTHGKILRFNVDCGPCTHKENYFSCNDNICLSNISPNSIATIVNEGLSYDFFNNRSLKEFYRHETNFKKEGFRNFFLKKLLKYKRRFPLLIYKKHSKAIELELRDVQCDLSVSKGLQKCVLLPIVINEYTKLKDLDKMFEKKSDELVMVLVTDFSLNILQKIRLKYYANLMFSKPDRLISFDDKFNFIDLNLKPILNIKSLFNIYSLNIDFFKIGKRKVHIIFKGLEKSEKYSENNVFHLNNFTDLINFEIYCNYHFDKKIKLSAYSIFLPSSRNFVYCSYLADCQLVRPYAYSNL